MAYIAQKAVIFPGLYLKNTLQKFCLMKTKHAQSVKVSPESQLAINLIKEELKCRKFFHALHLAGIEDCYFQPHLDTLILRAVGLDDGTDETFSFYTDIIDKRSKKIVADHASITQQALKVYRELMNEVKKKA